MPTTLHEQFRRVNQIVDEMRGKAESLASQFTTDSPRNEVIRLYVQMRVITESLDTAAATTGIADYAREQWGQPALDFIETAQAIRVAALDLTDFIAANYPTVRSTLNAAMTALSVPSGQQDALRAQMGGNLDFILVDKVVDGEVQPDTIQAAQLAPIVTRLNALAAAATI